MFFVERHYLREHGMQYDRMTLIYADIPFVGASFSEHFYGLKRRRKPVIETERANIAVGGIPQQEKLRRVDIAKSLLLLVRTLLP